MTSPRLVSVIEEAVRLTEESVPVVPLLPGRKPPIPKPRADDYDLAVHVVEDPFEVEAVFKALAAKHGDALNLGMMVGRQKQGPILSVGLDSYKPNGQEAHEWAMRMDISSRDPIWLIRTGRGGITACFYQPFDLELIRCIEPDGIPVDLLVNGYQVVPPSDTWLEPDGGGAYTWIRDHGPKDIPVAELMEPPEALVAYWKNRTTTIGTTDSTPSTTTSTSGKAWTLLKTPILKQRNVTLTRIAGWLRSYHPLPILEAMLMAFNDVLCRPPLPPAEVRSIARSVVRYPQFGVNGHPKAIVNPWKDPNGA